MSDPALAEVRDEIERSFTELKERFYPGSKQVRRALVEVSDEPAPETSTSRWDRNPQTHYINGRPMELFTIGALAEALNRRPVTLRAWEAKGYLPKATFRSRGEKSKRLYMREQIEGLVALATEEGLIDPVKGRAIEKTRFPQRAHKLFSRLKGAR